MSSSLVALCYGSAIVASLLLLWRFGATHWYWHLFSALAALALGLTPLPSAFNTFGMTLLVGWVFLFLFMWGAAAPVFSYLGHHGGQLGHHAH